LHIFTLKTHISIIATSFPHLEARLEEQQAELTAKLAEISGYSRNKRKIPQALKRSYGRLKSRVATTEAQVSKLNAKRDDVARAADLAAFAETLDNANSVVDSIQPDLSRVGNILNAAAVQNEENKETAQALHYAMSHGMDVMDEEDVLLELEQFELEQASPMPTSQVTTPTTQDLDGTTEQIIINNNESDSYVKNKTKKVALPS